MFFLHIDTDKVELAIATATIFLSDTKSSMKVLGYKPILYDGIVSGCLFVSDLYHETVSTTDRTLKKYYF